MLQSKDEDLEGIKETNEECDALQQDLAEMKEAKKEWESKYDKLEGHLEREEEAWNAYSIQFEAENKASLQKREMRSEKRK